MATNFWLIVLGTSIWMGLDSSMYKARYGVGPRGEGPALWVFSGIALWIIAFPMYLTYRRQPPEQWLGKLRGKKRENVERAIALKSADLPASSSEPGDRPKTSSGWHKDPRNDALLRYWDGQSWTEHTSPAIPPPSDPK